MLALTEGQHKNLSRRRSRDQGGTHRPLKSLTLHSIEPQRIASTILMERSFSALSLLVIIMVIANVVVSTAARPGSGRMRFVRELEQESEGDNTECSSELSAHNHDISSTVSDSNRFRREVGKTSSHKKSKRTSEDRRTNETGNSVCEKMRSPEPATTELEAMAISHSDLVEELCSEDEIPGCQPIPVVLHLFKMCSHLPVDIQEYTQLKTFVMRCPANPCCDPNHNCRAKASVEFNQTFKVMRQGQPMVVTIPLRNDTECTCAVCPSKCPKPFKPVKNKCECSCQHKSDDTKRNCEEIMTGGKKLKNSEKRCVEEKKCRLPICSSDRRYNIARGSCVPALT